jgi:hypothetical protein
MPFGLKDLGSSPLKKGFLKAGGICSLQRRSQEQTHIPKGVLWFMFNLRITKKLGKLLTQLITLITY